MMKVLLISFLWVTLNLCFVSVTRSEDNDGDTDLISLLDRYQGAKKLYGLIQANADEDVEEEIDEVDQHDQETIRLLRQINANEKLDSRTHPKKLVRRWELDDSYSGGNRASSTTPAATTITSTPPTPTTKKKSSFLSNFRWGRRGFGKK